jgi:hypothetical protein
MTDKRFIVTNKREILNKIVDLLYDARWISAGSSFKDDREELSCELRFVEEREHEIISIKWEAR